MHHAKLLPLSWKGVPGSLCGAEKGKGCLIPLETWFSFWRLLFLLFLCHSKVKWDSSRLREMWVSAFISKREGVVFYFGKFNARLDRGHFVMWLRSALLCASSMTRHYSNKIRWRIISVWILLCFSLLCLLPYHFLCHYTLLEKRINASNVRSSNIMILPQRLTSRVGLSQKIKWIV